MYVPLATLFSADPVTQQLVAPGVGGAATATTIQGSIYWLPEPAPGLLIGAGIAVGALWHMRRSGRVPSKLG